MRISLYYPFALTHLVAYRKTHDYEHTGEVLLMFEDSAHCMVAIRLERSALSALTCRIARDPDQPQVTD